MSQISAGNHANIILQPGQVVRVSTGGTATVVASYGAPAGTTTVTASTKDFGPYAVPAKLRVNAVTGAADFAQQSGNGDSGVLIGGGLRLISPLGLRRARRQFDDAQSQVAPVNAVGDSITNGWGADNIAVNYPSTPAVSAPTDAIGNSDGWVGKLRNLFAARFSGAGAGRAGFIAPQQTGAVLSGTGGGTPSEGQGIHNFALYLVSGAILTYTVPACTNIDVYYWESSGTGAFTVTIDGSGNSVAFGSGDQVYKKVSFTGLANTTHTVVITTAAITTQVGLGYHSGYGVTIGRFGRGGFGASDSIGLGDFNVLTPAASKANALNSYGMIANALTIVAFSNNDYRRQDAYGNSLAEYESSLRAIVAKVAAAGGCTLLLAMTERDPAHPTPANGPIAQLAYWDIMKKIAQDTDHVAHARMIDVLGAWAVAKAAGLLLDGEHPSRPGYGLIAASLFGLLTNLPGEAGL